MNVTDKSKLLQIKAKSSTGARLCALLVLLAIPSLALAQSAFDGTWVVNTHSASQSKPHTALLQNGVYWCKSCDPPYHVKADGKFHKVAGHSDFDMEAVRVMDKHTVRFTDKKDGKQVSESTVTVAPNGRTGTVVGRFVSHGKPVKVDLTSRRLTAGPAGSHAISGTWRLQHYNHVSKGLRTLTLNIKNNVLHVSGPTTDSYEVKLDGAYTPVPGSDPGESVSATMPNPHTLRQTFKEKGKVTSTTTMTVAADGKTLKLVEHNVKSGGTFTATAEKQ